MFLLYLYCLEHYSKEKSFCLALIVENSKPARAAREQFSRKPLVLKPPEGLSRTVLEQASEY